MVYFIDLSLLLLTGLSPGAASRGTTLGLLVSVASLVVENQLQGTWASVVSSPGLSSHGSWAQQLCGMSLVTPCHVGSSPTRDGTHVPCIARWILNHQTTSEVPKKLILKLWTRALPFFLKIKNKNEDFHKLALGNLLLAFIICEFSLLLDPDI